MRSAPATENGGTRELRTSNGNVYDPFTASLRLYFRRKLALVGCSNSSSIWHIAPTLLPYPPALKCLTGLGHGRTRTLLSLTLRVNSTLKLPVRRHNSVGRNWMAAPSIGRPLSPRTTRPAIYGSGARASTTTHSASNVKRTDTRGKRKYMGYLAMDRGFINPPGSVCGEKDKGTINTQSEHFPRTVGCGLTWKGAR